MNSHEIFTTQADRWNWDKYIEQYDLIDLSDADRERGRNSTVYLRTILGERFLERAEREGNPIFRWYFADASPGARLSLIRLTEALTSLESRPNFPRILKDIKRRLKTEEARVRQTEKLSIIDVAYSFLNAGFDVEFEPQVLVTNRKGKAGPKVPDMRIIDRESGEDVIIEVAGMQASDQHKLTSWNYRVMWQVLVDEGMHGDPEALKNILEPRYILPRAVIYRAIEAAELTDIVRQTRALIQHVRVSGEFGELIVPETIEIGIASYDNHHLAREWAAKRRLRPSDIVRAAPIESDEIVRAIRTLRKEVKQLPKDKPSVVVIQASRNLLFFLYDLRVVAAIVAEELKQKSHLICATFYHSFVRGREDSYCMALGLHTFVDRLRADGSRQQSLVIRNPVRTNVLSEETLKRLNTAFGC